MPARNVQQVRYDIPQQEYNVFGDLAQGLMGFGQGVVGSQLQQRQNQQEFAQKQQLAQQQQDANVIYALAQRGAIKPKNVPAGFTLNDQPESAPWSDVKSMESLSLLGKPESSVYEDARKNVLNSKPGMMLAFQISSNQPGAQEKLDKLVKSEADALIKGGKYIKDEQFVQNVWSARSGTFKSPQQETDIQRTIIEANSNPTKKYSVYNPYTGEKYSIEGLKLQAALSDGYVLKQPSVE